MLAGQITGPKKIEFFDIEEPRLKADSRGEVVFQPELACLCGSDLPYFENGAEVPVCHLGQSLHEMIGTVVATSGEKFRAGDKVLAVPIEHYGLFERYVLSEERAIPLDARVPPEQALMAQPLGTVIFALKKLPAVLDKDIVVVGQGPMGQLFNMALRNVGARKIIAIDKLPDRLELSRKTGATHVICNSQADPAAAVRELTEGRGPDIVVEVVGHKDSPFNLCVELCRPGGQLLLFGVPDHTMPDVRWKELFWKNLTIYTSVGPDFRRDFPLAMQWIGEGRVNVAPLITHRFPLRKIQEAFELFHSRRDGAIKVLIDYPAGQPG